MVSSLISTIYGQCNKMDGEGGLDTLNKERKRATNSG